MNQLLAKIDLAHLDVGGPVYNFFGGVGDTLSGAGMCLVFLIMLAVIVGVYIKPNRYK